jgi:hypothetical protein
MPVTVKYPLPPFLTGVCGLVKYHKWLRCKADQLQKRDKELGRPYAQRLSQADYKEKIHNAVLESKGRDPYTGDFLRWDLIGEWNSNKGPAFPRRRTYGAMKREFYLLPVADHVDPDSDDLELEMVSWIVNEGKSQMKPEEYRTLCRKVVDHGRKNHSGSFHS